MCKVQTVKTMVLSVELSPEEQVKLLKGLMAEWKLAPEECFAEQNIPEVLASAKPRRGRKPKQQPVSQETDAKKVAVSPEEQSKPRRGRKPKQQSASQETDVKKVAVSPEGQPKPRRGRKPKQQSASQETDAKKVAVSPEEQPKPRRGRKPKQQLVSQETDVKKVAVSPGEQPKPRRGRPPKIKKSEVSQDDEPKTAEKLNNSEVDLSNIDEEINKDILELSDVPFKDVEELEEQQTLSSKNKNRNSFFKYLDDYPVLQKQAMGCEYPHEYVYRYGKSLLLSPRVLPELLPIGIYVAYKNRVFGKYQGFIVDIYAENVYTNVEQAINAVQAEREPIDNELWSVMDSLQWSILRDKREIVNRMLGKIGGDALSNSYQTVSPGGGNIARSGKIRYTIEVK